MSKLRVESFSISLDGFGAGPEQSLDNPLGKGGEGLHERMESRLNHKVVIRQATTDDIEFMVHLFLLLAVQRNPNREGLDVEAIVQGTRQATREQVQGKLKESTTYAIESDGERVGRLRVVRTAAQIEIAGIQVLPDYQGRRIGTAVITALTQEGAVKDVPTMLEVEKDNPDAKRLYLRLGFEQQGETHDTFRMMVYPPLRHNHESEASATDRDVGKRQVHRDQQAG